MGPAGRAGTRRDARRGTEAAATARHGDHDQHGRAALPYHSVAILEAGPRRQGAGILDQVPGPGRFPRPEGRRARA